MSGQLSMPSTNVSNPVPEPPYRERLSTHDRIERGIIEPMAAWLCAGLPRSLHMLDAGCGKGAPALVFAEQGCTVTGIDAEAGEAEAARQLFAVTPFSSASFQQGDVLHTGFSDATFDLVWTSYVLHHVADKLAAVRELQRVLKPGARLAIREDGLPVQMLPFRLGMGEQPGLQDRLRVADNLWFARMIADTLPDEVDYPYGWAQLLIDAGFGDVTARTFTLDLLPPFDAVQSEFAVNRLHRALKTDASPYGPVLSDEDRAVVQALVDPSSPHYLLRRADLHLRYGLSVYVGTKIG
jgi:SAM-dependent methyltransferase